MQKFRALCIAGLILICTQVFTLTALAHPLGNFTVNQYVGLTINPERVAVDYVVDMAEIPALQAITELGADGNGPPSPEETNRYHMTQCQTLGPGLRLQVNGKPVALTLATSSVEFPAGQGGLLTLRLNCQYQANVELPGQPVNLSFVNSNYPDRLGWREIVVGAQGWALSGDFATSSSSQRLTHYPNDLLSNPPDQRKVKVSMEVQPLETTSMTGRQASLALPAADSTPTTRRDDAFTRLIHQKDRSLPAILLALGIAVVWGAMHAATPGHGKTVVGAYLVGSRGTARHALGLGLTTTVTHTAGVYALGFIALMASRYVMPERLFPWLSLVSGLLVASIGIRLVASRMGGLPRLRRQARAYPVHSRDDDPSHTHDHPHDHSHDDEHSDHSHDHGFLHGHDHDHGHNHLPPGADGSPMTWRSLLALGISGGLLPCPSAMVIMLGAVAVNRTAFGLALVLAFSIGLAGVLTGIGLLFIYAGRYSDRLPVPSGARRLLPAVSALFVTFAGLGIAFKALTEIGLIR